MGYDWSKTNSAAPAKKGGGFMDSVASFGTKYGGAIGMGMGVGGAIGGALASFYQASSAKRDLEFRAKLAAHSANQENQRAVEAAAAGSAEVDKIRMKQQQVEGTQRAQIAARGGNANEGSAARVLSDTKYISDLDAKQVMSNTDKEVFALRQSARAKSFDSNAMKARAKAISPKAAGFTSLLSDSGRIAARWYADTRTTGVRG